MTDLRPDTDPTSPKPRGLWSLMGGASVPSDATTNADALQDEPLHDETPNDEKNSTPPEESADSILPDEAHATIDEPTADEPTSDEPTVESPSPKRRGLWGLMRQMEAEPSTNAASPATASSPPSKAETAADDESAENEFAGDSGPDPRLRAAQGLFTLMRRGDTTPRREQTSDAEATGDEFADGEAESEDGSEHRNEAEVDQSANERSPDDEVEAPDDEADNDSDYDYEELAEPQPATLPTPPVMMEVIQPEDLEPARYRRANTQARRQCWVGFACGIAAVAASALAILPHVWSGFPATGLGFAAIISGYLALTGAARRELTFATRSASVMGMLLGTLGVFLGPLLFANLGRSLREETGQQLTQQHLKQVGGAIDRYYAAREAYPIGGTFARDEAGAIKGQHGWMTFLLPFVGQDELYHSIDMSQPFDAPVNRTAMGRDVVTFFAAGGDRSKIGQGFAVSHYAGVGGEIDDDRGLSHVGIFERDVAVKRDEITDGLSNTLIVGELAGNYPPWGDPENWRTIGRGLNRDANGFGSAAGNGAAFLLGDGAVKFFSNKTDPKLLERLSTRDGGE
jgi:Protein of unknown function (DUF1559)